MCKYFMTYSYNEHGNNSDYTEMKNIKWIVTECDKNMLDDIFILNFRFIQTQYGHSSVEAILLTYNLNNHGLQYKT